MFQEVSIQEQLLYRNVQRFRGGLVFKAHRLVYHLTLGLRILKKKTTPGIWGARDQVGTLKGLKQVELNGPPSNAEGREQSHTVEHDPFIKSQPTFRNQFQGQIWCNFSHVTP